MAPPLAVEAALPRHLSDGVSVWSGARLADLRSSSPEDYEALREAVDALGAASGVAQELKGPLTTAAKLVEAPGQRLYLLHERGSVAGLVKVGEKHLYYWRRGGGTVELDPVCVLDFYVSAQRAGRGRALFDAMARAERRDAKSLAYDRPSPKMLPFLKRHFGLADYVEQPNNFVIYDSFFGKDGAPPRAVGRAAPGVGRVVGTL